MASVAITGFYIFRASNAQKDTFKKDPNHPSVKRECGRRAAQPACNGLPLLLTDAVSDSARVASTLVPILLLPTAAAVTIVADLRVVVTDTGRKLLAGGWWGVSRHLNYFGDWLLSLGMSLCTGE